MTAYLSFEWLKFSRRWMPRVILIMVLGLLAIFFWGQGTRVEDQPNLILPRGWLTALVFGSFFAPFFWPVLGGSWAGNEYGWGTIRMILTRRPYRVQQVFAALAILLIGLALALVAMLAVSSAAGFLVSLFTNNAAFTSSIMDGTFAAALVKAFLSAWYVGAFYLILAYAAATIFRSAAVGIGIGIGSTLAEVVLRGIFVALGGTWKDIANHFPVMYTNDLTRQIVASQMAPGTGFSTIGPDVPGLTESVLAIAIYIAILLGITVAAVRSRDVTA